MGCSNRKICDCGRPATKVKCGESICARCYRLEGIGIAGGPSNRVAGGYQRLYRKKQKLLNSQLINS